MLVMRVAAGDFLLTTPTNAASFQPLANGGMIDVAQKGTSYWTFRTIESWVFHGGVWSLGRVAKRPGP